MAGLALLLVGGPLAAQQQPPAGGYATTIPAPDLLPPPPPPKPKAVPVAASAPVVAPTQTLFFNKEAAPAPKPAAVPAAREVVRQTVLQEPAARRPEGAQTLEQLGIETRPPGFDRLYRLESEADLDKRIIEEGKQRDPPEPDVAKSFPNDYAPLSNVAYTGRQFASLTEYVEPNYVCYHRLYFQEKNAERYGWEIGFLQPVISAGYFFKDFLFLPYHIALEPCQRFECSAGYCLPGDPVPYLLYPPPLSITGATAETGIVLGLAFAIP